MILFVVVAQIPPFGSATSQDKYYKALVKKPELFWSVHCKNQPEGDAFFTDDFKDLIAQLL